MRHGLRIGICLLCLMSCAPLHEELAAALDEGRLDEVVERGEGFLKEAPPADPSRATVRELVGRARLARAQAHRSLAEYEALRAWARQRQMLPFLKRVIRSEARLWYDEHIAKRPTLEELKRYRTRYPEGERIGEVRRREVEAAVKEASQSPSLEVVARLRAEYADWPEAKTQITHIRAREAALAANAAIGQGTRAAATAFRGRYGGWPEAAAPLARIATMEARLDRRQRRKETEALLAPLAAALRRRRRLPLDVTISLAHALQGKPALGSGADGIEAALWRSARRYSDLFAYRLYRRLFPHSPRALLALAQEARLRGQSVAPDGWAKGHRAFRVTGKEAAMRCGWSRDGKRVACTDRQAGQDSRLLLHVFDLTTGRRVETYSIATGDPGLPGWRLDRQGMRRWQAEARRGRYVRARPGTTALHLPPTRVKAATITVPLPSGAVQLPIPPPARYARCCEPGGEVEVWANTATRSAALRIEYVCPRIQTEKDSAPCFVAGGGAVRRMMALGVGPSAARLDRPPLLDTLIVEVGRGQPVAVVATDDGLLAVSSDGTRRRVLVPSPVSSCLVDHRHHVIWFGSGTALFAIDLLAAELTVRRVLDKTPEDVRFAIRTGDQVLRFGTDLEEALLVDLSPKGPRIDASPGLMEMIAPDEARAFVKAAKRLTFSKSARAFLVGLERRKPRITATASSPKPAGALPRVPIDRSRCEEPSLCGEAEPVPNRPEWLVIVGHSCGDGCYVTKQLYDPRRRVFLDPLKPSLRSRQPSDADAFEGGIRVAPDGSAFVGEAGLVRFGVGRLLKANRGGGWLPEGATIR